MGDKKEEVDQSPEPMVGFVVFIMALISLLSVVCNGLLVAYTTVYLTGIRTVVLGFVQFSMAFISLVLVVITAPVSQIYYEYFPVLMHPPDRALTIGLWQCALAAFIVGDPSFMDLRDPKTMNDKPSWVQSMASLTLASACALGGGFVMGLYGFFQFKNDPKFKKDKEDKS